MTSCKSGGWAITSKLGRRHPKPALPAFLGGSTSSIILPDSPSSQKPAPLPPPGEGDSAPSCSPPVTPGGVCHLRPSQSLIPFLFTAVSGHLPSERTLGEGTVRVPPEYRNARKPECSEGPKGGLWAEECPSQHWMCQEHPPPPPSYPLCPSKGSSSSASSCSCNSLCPLSPLLHCPMPAHFVDEESKAWEGS